MIAKAIDATNTHHGTVWIVEDITDGAATPTRWRACCASTRPCSARPRSASPRGPPLRAREPRYEEMYGYGPGELIGQSVSPIYPSAQAFCEAASIYQALARPDHAQLDAGARTEHGAAPTVARSIRNPHKGRSGLWRTLPPSAVPRRSCSASWPSSRRSSTT